MKPQDFVHAVKIAVFDAAIHATSQVLSKPPGRKPSEELQDLSQWIQGLSDSDRKRIRLIIEFATYQAIFGILSVLDGVRQIETGNAKGQLKLLYVKNGESNMINGADGEFLHELLHREVQLKV